MPPCREDIMSCHGPQRQRQLPQPRGHRPGFYWCLPALPVPSAISTIGCPTWLEPCPCCPAGCRHHLAALPCSHPNIAIPSLRYLHSHRLFLETQTMG